MLQAEPVDAFSAIVHKDKAYAYGVMMTAKLKELIPRQQFEVPVQAAVGLAVIARETVRASARMCRPSAMGRHHPKAQAAREQKEARRMKMVAGLKCRGGVVACALRRHGGAKGDRK